MEPADGNLGKLANESMKRKERLRQLREKAGKGGGNTQNAGDDDQKVAKPVFRSYKPQNELTIGEVIPHQPSGNIEEAVVDQLELLNQPIVIDEIDITNLAPRKPDWDLKRDVAKKLDRLDRRTQKVIAELIRERLKKNQDGQDIFQAVNVATSRVVETKNADD